MAGEDRAQRPRTGPAALAVALAHVLVLAASATANAQQPAAAPPPAAEADAEARSGAPGPRVPPIRPVAPVIAAKTLFGAAKEPAPLAARAIGNYSKGCLAGGRQLSTDGPAWQAMRLSRNRQWGHPNLIALLERFAVEARDGDGWPGLLVGDISQPRGGPMLTGHASHQIGLDADIWLTPMPNRRLSTQEREDIAATSMLAAGDLAVDPAVWTPTHVRLIRRAAAYPEVERVLVHPAIKKALCDASVQDPDRTWLHKVRPIWGHYYHFHVRISCPAGEAGCQAQKAVPGDDGCGKELADWYRLLMRPARPDPVPTVPPSERRVTTLAELPAECKVVLEAGKTRSASRP
jgi:penicillin-insensitive murein endopeptidase